MRRKRLGEQGWREVMERFAASGQAVSQFCKREGVGVSSFYQWRSCLSSAALPALSSKPSGLRKTPPAGFVDLGLMAGQDSASAKALELRLELGAGVVLHVVRR